MTSLLHSYGQKCRLAPVTQRDDSNAFDDTPPIASQFFYKSAFAIDGTLSQGPLAGTSDSKGSSSRLRPFAEGDNNALERAWLSMISEEDNKLHREACSRKRLGRSFAEANNTKLAALIRVMAARHFEKHEGDLPGLMASMPESSPENSIMAAPACCEELPIDVSSELQNSFCALARKRQASLGLENVVHAVVIELQRRFHASRPRSGPGNDGEHGGWAESHNSPRGFVSLDQINMTPKQVVGSPMSQDAIRPGQLSGAAMSQPEVAVTPVARGPPVDDGMSGTPFIRVESPGSGSEPAPISLPHHDSAQVLSLTPDLSKSGDAPDDRGGLEIAYARATKEVAVGISRLHMVSIPALQMKPIYWSPINDVSVVMRATWFYR